MRKVLAIAVAVCAFALQARCAEAATFNLLTPHVMTVEGSIELGDCERWNAIVRPTVTNVVLNSPGGNVYEGKCMSRAISARRMITFVRERCASICFLMFAAGSDRWACENSRIGVHHPRSIKTGKESDPEILNGILDYAQRYRVPQPIQMKLSTTPSADVYWLNASDLASMQVKRCPATVVAGRPAPRATSGAAAAPAPVAMPAPNAIQRPVPVALSTAPLVPNAVATTRISTQPTNQVCMNGTCFLCTGSMMCTNGSCTCNGLPLAGISRAKPDSSLALKSWR